MDDRLVFIIFKAPAHNSTLQKVKKIKKFAIIWKFIAKARKLFLFFLKIRPIACSSNSISTRPSIIYSKVGALGGESRMSWATVGMTWVFLLCILEIVCSKALAATEHGGVLFLI